MWNQHYELSGKNIKIYLKNPLQLDLLILKIRLFIIIFLKSGGLQFVSDLNFAFEIDIAFLCSSLFTSYLSLPTYHYPLHNTHFSRYTLYNLLTISANIFIHKICFCPLNYIKFTHSKRVTVITRDFRTIKNAQKSGF